MSTYKYCIVPMCESTSKKYPQKFFLNVPKDEARRKEWCRLMKRGTPISDRSTCYVCEDHFDMLNDTENYMRVKLMGGNLIQKSSAVPHIFHCQKRGVLPPRPFSEERKRKSLIKELLESSCSTPASDAPETIIPDTISLEESMIDMGVLEESKGEQMPNDVENYMKVKLMGGKLMLKKDTAPHIFKCQDKPILPENLLSEKRKRKAIASDFLKNEYSYADRGISDESLADTNVDKVSFRDKGVQARCYFRSKATQVTLKGSKFAAPVQPAGVSSSAEENPTSEKQKTIPVESVVGVKTEPAYPIPSTSNNTDKEEFILPHPHSSWTTPNSHLSVDNEPVVSDGGPLNKKQRTDSPASTSVSDSSVVSNHTVLSQSISNISSSSNHCKNQFEGFGNYVADKLNCLDSQSALRAQKAIESILLEAEMGKYLDETQDIKPSIVPF